jgi:lysyl endopeptidase
VFYAGWDTKDPVPAPDATVGIHHPLADVKAISTSNTQLKSTTYFDGTTSFPNHWQVSWQRGGTEEGSSGSCLFNASDGRCIGQLHGGDALGCQTPTPDNYGKFSVSWVGGDTKGTRLSNWLDPLGIINNTTVTVIEGDTHITTTNGVPYDFQAAGEFISLRDPNGLEIQTRQAPVPTSSTVPDAYSGLNLCVSINTAVAARVGKHRVSYQPSLNSTPDPRHCYQRYALIMASARNARNAASVFS